MGPTTPTKLRPFLSFYGAKYRLAPRYPPPSTHHAYLIEPFAGSAGYSVHHCHPHLTTILYELDPIIAGVWDYLIKVTPAEILRLPCDFDHVSSLPSWVPQEARWLIGFWLGKANSSPRSSKSSWGKSGNYSNSYFWEPKTKLRLANQVPLIRHWRVYNHSYDRCPKSPEHPATYFVDPPYQGRPGSHYKFGSNHLDYDSLAEWCKSRAPSDHVIACEQQSASWLPFQPLAKVKALKRIWTEEVWWSSKWEDGTHLDSARTDSQEPGQVDRQESGTQEPEERDALVQRT